MALRVALPAHLVDINGVAELNGLAVEGGELSIGACVRHSAFHRPVLDGPLGRLLAAVVRHIACYPVRTRGTFCGSLAHADPASEWCLVAATLGATMIAKSVRGTRAIAAKDYFKGLMATALAPDELLAEARLPILPADARCGFYEFNRRAGDFAFVMALGVYRIERGVMADPRVGVGAIEDHPRRIRAAEAVLEGRAPCADVFRAAADAAAEALDPTDTQPGTAAYKRDLARTAVRRALEAAR
jgi:carbon-monoxide dehydrogenase medium subunit